MSLEAEAVGPEHDRTPIVKYAKQKYDSNLVKWAIAAVKYLIDALTERASLTKTARDQRSTSRADLTSSINLVFVCIALHATSSEPRLTDPVDRGQRAPLTHSRAALLRFSAILWYFETPGIFNDRAPAAPAFFWQ